MAYVVRGWGWGYLREEEFNENRVQKLIPCWVTKDSHLTSDQKMAAVFQVYDDAQSHLWSQDSWWEPLEDGRPAYWIEES